MACASQTPTALLLASCQCRVSHPWTLNPAAAKYCRPIRLAAGFQSARRRRRTRRVVSDAISHGDFNRISYRYERRLSNTVELCSYCWKMAKNAPFDIKSPVKKSMVGPKGGIASSPSLKYATGTDRRPTSVPGRAFLEELQTAISP